MRHREPAICLRCIDYSETSQVVHFLTRLSGVVHLLAKGSKRPKSSSGGALDVLSEGDLVFSTTGRDRLDTLIEFSETVSRGPLRREASRLNAALYTVELVSLLLAEADPHPEVFDLLHSVMVRLGQPDSPIAAVLTYFQWRLLRRVGLLGEMKNCVSCNAPVGGYSTARGPRRDIHFSSIEGGLLCATCQGPATEKYRLDGAALAGLAAIAAAETGTRVTLSDKQANAVNRLLAYHVTQQLGKAPKMARYVIGDGL